MRAMIKSHPSDEDTFWRHVSYIVAQYDGLYAGYKAAAQPDWVMPTNLRKITLQFVHLRDVEFLS
jgi:hypothetical protein